MTANSFIPLTKCCQYIQNWVGFVSRKCEGLFVKVIQFIFIITYQTMKLYFANFWCLYGYIFQ